MSVQVAENKQRVSSQVAPGAPANSPVCGRCVPLGCLLCLAAFCCVQRGATAAEWTLDAQASSRLVAAEEPDLSTAPDVTRFQLRSSADVQLAYFNLTQAPSLPHDDFRATVDVGGSVVGIRLALRLRLPNQLDPRTGQPIVAYVRGEKTLVTGKLQKLTVGGSVKAVQAVVRELRAETFQTEINASGAYFDGCAVIAEVHRGTSFVDIGDANYGPVVTIPAMKAFTDSVDLTPQHLPVEIRRDRVLLGGHDRYPRIMPDHGESVEFLQRLGINAVWVSDLGNVRRMKELRDNGIVVVATPPHPEFDPADFRVPLQGLPPLEKSHPFPSIWYLGTGVNADQLSHLLAWGREVRSADRKLSRPLMADVKRLEGVASRQIDFVGISQQTIGGHQSFGKARNRSYLRQNASAQLMLPWEWVQAQAPASYNAWRTRSGFEPAIVEPEQVLMQTVAVLSSGCQGMGIWKTASLEPSPGQPTSETALAIELAGLYVRILEPFLVKGNVEGHIGIRLPGKSAKERTRGSWLDSALENQTAEPSSYTADVVVPDAALINSTGTSLILAGFWDESSHLVPQELYASEASATVASAETASAWQISATGIRGLRRKPTAGGLQLDLRDFDQLAIVLVSSNLSDRDLAARQIHSQAERASNVFVDMANSKLSRVRQTCAAVNRLAGDDQTASQLLSRAERLTLRAEEYLSRKQFANAEKYARTAMRELRVVQSRYWYRAVQSLPTPMASPHTTSFSTLPEHWRMMSRIGTNAPGENLIPSGTFEDLRMLSEGAWVPIPPQEEAYQSNADVVADSRDGNQVLRIRTWLQDENRQSLQQPSFLVRSPEFQVEKGAVYEITGRVRMGRSVVADQPSSFSVFDSDMGPEYSVKPATEASWRTFRILRQPSASGPFKVWLSIRGTAEVFVDDLVVRRVAPAVSSEVSPPIAKAPILTPTNRKTSSQVQGAGYSIELKR